MLKIEILMPEFTVCKLKSMPKELPCEKFCFLSVTDSEISLVCPTEYVKDDVLVREDLWRGFRICGTLDFSLVGILAEISQILAEAEISIFAVSTYDTDYIFTKSKSFENAMKVLSENGYTIKSTEI